ncbi:MAG: hypothetical protein ABIL14_05675 [candidate division WOR-3 bacterium]
MKLIGKTIFYFCILFVFLICAPEPVVTGEDKNPIELFNTPHMEMIDNLDTIKTEIDGINFTIKLKYRYKVGGIVLSKKRYSGGWQGKLVPYDFALAWGELLKDDLYKKIKWWQEARWYHWIYRNDFPKDHSFIARYSSNNHLIPATKNILYALNKIKKGDVVEFSGYLVNLDGTKEGNNFWWHSSTSTNDTGAGSCEIIYLTRLRFNGMIYE